MDNEIENKNETLENSSKNEKVKKKNVNKSIFEHLQGRFIHIKIGNEIKPSTDDDIDKMQKKFDKYMEDNNIDCIAFVTHHAVEITVI